MIFGLGTALCWGIADLAAAVSGRRIGAIATLIVAQLAGLATLAVVLVATSPPLAVRPVDGAILLANGVLAAVAYVWLYRGLELGPVALVSPIVAAYAAIPIALAVVLLGESLATLVLAGAVVTLVGVGLTSTDVRSLSRKGRETGRRVPSGVPHAVGALIAFGFSTFTIAHFARDAGWFPAVALSRAGTAVALLAGTAATGRKLVPATDPGTAFRAVLAGVGDVLGLVLFAVGSRLGSLSIVSAVSATFPLIPVAGGLLLFDERPAINQGFGVALVIGGLVLLAIGQ